MVLFGSSISQNRVVAVSGAALLEVRKVSEKHSKPSEIVLLDGRFDGIPIIGLACVAHCVEGCSEFLH